MEKNVFEEVRDKAVEEVLSKYLSGSTGTQKKIAMRQLLEDLVDEIMKGERNVFLDMNYNNKGNGYYPRELTTGSWKLNVTVPRDRNGNFRPYVLPQPYKRTDDSYVDLLMSLVINGYSESQLLSTFRQGIKKGGGYNQ